MALSVGEGPGRLLIEWANFCCVCVQLGQVFPGGCVIIRYTASWYRRGETCFVYQTVAPCFRQYFGRCFANGQKNLDFFFLCVCVFFCSLYVFWVWFVVSMYSPCAPYNDVVLLWVCTARVPCVATLIVMALHFKSVGSSSVFTWYFHSAVKQNKFYINLSSE